MTELATTPFANAQEIAVPPVSGDRVLRGTTVSVPSTQLGDVYGGHQVAFRILGVLGEGGMGIVYRAEQDFPRRIVAVKVIKGVLADSQAHKRFAREIEIMGRLCHRGIAQIYFAGVLDDQGAGSSPFMAMEYVQGTSVIQYVHDRQPSLTHRLELFASICDIVSYAHGQGVVHRDLKPSNILVDQQGQPKLLDFGLAGMLDLSQDGKSFVTVAGQTIGTLEYMSPEQAAGRVREIDERSDVFALGIVLYELLAQRLPFDVSGVSLVDAARIIHESNPPKLSQFNRSHMGDLDTIVHKALCKEKEGRYASVSELAADLRRLLSHEPIRARPPTVIYRTSRFIRRNRLLVASVSAVITALTVGLGVAIDQAVLAKKQTALVRDEEYKTQLLLADSRAMQGDFMLQAARYFGLQELLKTTWDQYDMLHAPAWKAQIGLWQVNQICAIPLRVFDSGHDQLACGEFSSDQRLIARGFASGLVDVRDVITNEKKFEAHLPSNVSTVGFSPDGNYLLITTSDMMHICRIRDGVTMELRPRDVAGRFAKLGNDRIIYPTSDGKLHIESFDGKTLAPEIPVADSPIRGLQVADGSTYVITQHWHVLKLLSGETQFNQLGILEAASSDDARFSPNARHIVLAHKNELVIINTSTCEPCAHVTRESGHCGFAGDQAVYATRGFEAPLEIFDLTGKMLRVIPTGGYMSAVMSGDLALTHSAGVAQSTLWSLHAPPQVRVLQAQSAIHPIAGDLSADGFIAAIGNDDSNVVLKDTQGARTLRVLDAGKKPMSVAFSGNLHWLAVATETQLQLWDLLKGGPPFRFDFPRVLRLEFSLKGDIAVMYLPWSQKLAVLRYKNEQWQEGEFAVQGSVHTIKMASDSSRFLVVDNQNEGQLWSVGQTTQFTRAVGNSSVNDPANGNGELALTHSTSQKKIAIWNLTSGIRAGELPPIPGTIYDVAVSKANIGAAIDSTSMYLFDLRTCQLLCQLPLPIKGAVHLRLSANGSKALLLGQSGGAAIMDLSIPATLRALPEQPNASLDISAKVRCFYVAGLTEQALPSYLEHSERVLRSPTVVDGFAFRDANDTKTADCIFNRCSDLSEGTKILLGSPGIPDK